MCLIYCFYYFFHPCLSYAKNIKLSYTIFFFLHYSEDVRLYDAFILHKGTVKLNTLLCE